MVLPVSSVLSCVSLVGLWWDLPPTVRLWRCWGASRRPLHFNRHARYVGVPAGGVHWLVECGN